MSFAQFPDRREGSKGNADVPMQLLPLWPGRKILVLSEPRCESTRVVEELGPLLWPFLRPSHSPDNTNPFRETQEDPRH